MDSRGQHLCTSGSEVSSSASLSAPSLALEDVALAPSVEPQVFPHLRPLIVKMPGVSGGFRGELFARGDVLGQTYSPKGLVQNMMQPARPQQPVARLGDLSGYPQYEDFAGILGDRLASGSLSDVSVSAMSERAQICSSGHSSSGENSGPRLKFMCSFGGKILPRPVDGKLRYVGGDTRIISIHRHTNYTTLLHKMRHIYGREVILKYQLPNEDLDALITILSDEDVENMMEEYDRLEVCEPSSRLRIFLFSPAEYNVNSLSGLNDSRNTDQLYVDTINGIPEPSPMKLTDTVTVSCANALTGVDVADTWSGPLFVKNVSVALPVAPMLQVTGACIKPMPVAMPSYTKQVVLRNVSASPSMPSSPTISSQLAQAKQCTIPDLSSHVYADQSAKTPITHFHEMQRLDAIYQEIEGARSASSSLGSQHDGVYQPLELKRVMDPSLVAQHDSSIEQSCRLEQDPMMSRVDSHLPRMLRVNSHGNLVPVMQQHIEVEAPSLTLDRQLESNLADISHPLSNFQTFTLQQEVPSSQVGWQHALESRRPGYQGMDMMHLTTLENVQAHQPVLNQQMAPQYFLPGGIPSQEVAYLRPVEQPVQLAYPPTLLQSSTAPGMVAIPSSMIHPGSAPQSPRVIPQESKLNQSMAPQYATGQRSFIRSQVDQSFARTAVHSNFHQANRVFKPLNTHLEHQEQVLRVVDGPIRQHPPAPVSKVEEMQTANNLLINEGEPLQSCFVDGLTRPMVPPYPGAGLYPDQATVFEDRGVIRNDDQMHAYEQEDGFSLQSQYQGAVDWAWKRGHNEDNLHGWTQGNHLDPQGELNLGSSGITGKPSIPMDVLECKCWKQPLSLQQLMILT